MDEKPQQLAFTTELPQPKFSAGPTPRLQVQPFFMRPWMSWREMHLFQKKCSPSLLEKQQPQSKLSAGFTMVEVVIMLAIIAGISAIVLFNFTGLNEGAALVRAAHELAVEIRVAQNDSLAIAQYDPANPPPEAVGVRISSIPAESKNFFLFADWVRDNAYTPSAVPPEKRTTFGFERNVRINAITNQGGATQSVIHIVFTAPEATMIITDAIGVSLGDKVDIVLAAPSGQTKKITVRTSGQVSVQ